MTETIRVFYLDRGTFIHRFLFWSVQIHLTYNNLSVSLCKITAHLFYKKAFCITLSNQHLKRCKLVVFPSRRNFKSRTSARMKLNISILSGLVDRKVNKFGRKSFTKSSLLPWKLVDLLMMPTANQPAVFSRVIYKQFYSTEPKEFFIIFLLYLGSLPRPTEALIP